MDTAELSVSDFNKFRALIHDMTGISMADTKRTLVQSRLQRRLRHHSMEQFGEYFALVTSGDADEVREFINCVTTNTTSFFREQHHFDFVERKFLPAFAKSRAGESQPKLRIWHAGCSSGEEPYTLSIVLQRAIADQNLRLDVKQLASDIDTDVLTKAASGVYSDERVAGLPESVLRSSFLRRSTEQGYLYKVKPHLRAPLTFRQINLLADEWPMQSDTKFDMIWCRNVVIYFDKDTQRKLFARFAERIKPGGYLFIGHSESLLGVSDQFESLGQTMYRMPEQARVRKAA